MTTNANKHGLRAAAAERSRKHAQRTPLPPRAGVVETARDVLTSVSRMKEVSKGADRSGAKAVEFQLKAEAAGWTVKLTAEDDRVALLAVRADGVEAIHQAWVNGLWQYEASTYSFTDRTTKPRNASGAAKLLGRSHEDAAAEMTKVASNKHFRKREPADLKPMALPFDAKEAGDEEIAAWLRGQTIVWYNRLSRSTETAMVGRGSLVWLAEYHGERTVTVCCPATGFRSFHLSAILKLGRGSVKAAGETVKVELEDAA
jgi:hypothetical protein